MHNRAIGWREAELMREVQLRWRETERDGREAWQMGAPWFLSAVPKKSSDKQTVLAPGPFDYTIVNHHLGGFVCLLLDRR